MSDISISIMAGESKRLLTAGKYCPNNILVTAEGSSEGDTGLDTSDATATKKDILYGKSAYVNGKKLDGEMVDWGQQIIEITPESGPFDGLEGYRQSLTARAIYAPLSITPTKEGHEEIATTMFFSKVTIAPIPDQYQDVTFVTATAPNVLAGDVFVDAAGKQIVGTMKNNDSVSATIDGLKTSVYTIPQGYHDGTGTVSLTSSIEEALAAI